MAADNVAVRHLNNITECPICRDVYTDHRALSCFHAFCLKCLVTYADSKQPGESLPCPVCRKEFVIPAEGGLAALQRNFFIDKLLDVKKRHTAHENADKTCDWCSGEDGAEAGKV